MEVFKLIQVYFIELGVNANQSVRSHPFNAKNVMVLIIFILSILSNLIYLIGFATTFEEYTSCLNLIASLVVCFMVFAIIVWKMKELFEFIKLLDHMIQKSKNISFKISQELQLMWKSYL